MVKEPVGSTLDRLVVQQVEQGKRLREVMLHSGITAERVWKAIERHARRSKR